MTTRTLGAGACALAVAVSIVACAPPSALRPTSASVTASQPTAAEPQSLQSERNVRVVKMEAALVHIYPTVADLAKAENLEMTVLGTVTDVQYQLFGDVATTLFTVDVDKADRGSSANRRVVVLETGGILPASVLAEQNQDKFPTASPPGPEDVFDFRFDGAAHPAKGDVVLLFLTRNPNPGFETTFFTASGPYGRFTLDPSTGDFVRASALDGWQTTVSSEGASRLTSGAAR